jgi:hypothetical protein
MQVDEHRDPEDSEHFQECDYPGAEEWFVPKYSRPKFKNSSEAAQPILQKLPNDC